MTEMTYCDTCRHHGAVVYNYPTVFGSLANLCRNCLALYGERKVQ